MCTCCCFSALLMTNPEQFEITTTKKWTCHLLAMFKVLLCSNIYHNYHHHHWPPSDNLHFLTHTRPPLLQKKEEKKNWEYTYIISYHLLFSPSLSFFFLCVCIYIYIYIYIYSLFQHVFIIGHFVSVRGESRKMKTKRKQKTKFFLIWKIYFTKKIWGIIFNHASYEYTLFKTFDSINGFFFPRLLQTDVYLFIYLFFFFFFFF